MFSELHHYLYQSRVPTNERRGAAGPTSSIIQCCRRKAAEQYGKVKLIYILSISVSALNYSPKIVLSMDQGEELLSIVIFQISRRKLFFPRNGIAILFEGFGISPAEIVRSIEVLECTSLKFVSLSCNLERESF